MRQVPSVSWSMRQSCSGPPVKAGSATSSRVLGGGQRAVRAGDGDLEIRRAGIAAGVGDGRNRPLLLGLAQVVGHADVDVARGPIRRNLRDILRRNHAARAAEQSAARPPVRRRSAQRRRRPPAPPPGPPRPRTAASPDAPAADRHSLHRQLERRAGAHGFDLIRAFLEVLAGDGPAVFPQQRADIEHAGAAPVEVGFIVAGELLHAVAQIEQAEVAGADHAAAGADEKLAAALDHVDAHVVEEGAGHLPARGRRECCSRSRRRDSNCRAWPAGNTSRRDRS